MVTRILASRSSLLRLVCTASMLVGLATASQAGHWNFSASGSTASTTVKNHGVSQTTPSWSPPADSTNTITIGLPGASAVDTTGTPFCECGGTATIKITATWVADPSLPSDPAPDDVWLIEQSNVSWAAGTSIGFVPPTFSGSCTDALGDPDVEHAKDGSSSNGTAPAPTPPDPPVGWKKYHVDSSSGTPTITIEHSLSVHASATSSTPGSCRVSCNLGSYSISIHATPYNFHHTTVTDSGNGELVFKYTWSSTSGNTGDLGSCYWHERVTYDGDFNPYYPPAPFNVPNGIQNPTVSLDFAMSSVGLEDTQHVVSTSPPYSAVSFTASQRYEYDDHGTGETNLLIPGPTSDTTASIVRSVTKRPPMTPTWWYSITKQGVTAWLALGD